MLSHFADHWVNFFTLVQEELKLKSGHIQPASEDTLQALVFQPEKNPKALHLYFNQGKSKTLAFVYFVTKTI